MYGYFNPDSKNKYEPYFTAIITNNIVELKFTEGEEFCGNCFEVDTIYKKVMFPTTPLTGNELKNKTNKSKKSDLSI